MKKGIVKDLNCYLANTGVLFVKLHNLHWNVVGKQFKGTHEYLETLYDGFAEVLDEVAELLVMHGETPKASMKEYLEVATITEIDSVEVSVDKALKTVAKDIEVMQKLAESIRKKASEEDLYDIVAALEGHLGQYSKTLWFLKAMSK
ncbi:MAG: Dps family protein [Anaerorhabdus sp.]